MHTKKAPKSTLRVWHVVALVTALCFVMLYVLSQARKYDQEQVELINALTKSTDEIAEKYIVDQRIVLDRLEKIEVYLGELSKRELDSTAASIARSPPLKIT